MGDLSAHQAALEEHFGGLARQRSGARIFALEHGLDEAQRAEIRAELRSCCTARGPSDRHWLVWTVYAAELGYEYAGREYWQTFEQETSGWRQKGSRQWIRECFQRFASSFAGFKPAGAWAEHFSIICWPIVHAVLPRDLQVRVARMLYDVRHSFSPATLTDPSALGSLIATRGWLGSARLEQLADDVEIIGSVALALLFRDREHAGVALLTPTVDRIAADLARHRHARDWLSDARTSAAAVALKGLRPPAQPVAAQPARPATAEEARRLLDELGVEPTVHLAPGPEGWLVMLGLPNLSPLIARFPDLRQYLAGTRPTVVGWSEEPLARQRVLQGDERIRLRSWPTSTDVLLRFENAPELLRVVLSAECLLRPGPTWVFRIGSDKVAYELRGRIVRPGQEYIILTAEMQPSSALNLASETVACDGIRAYRMRVPALAGDEYKDALRALSLSVARAVRVRPAGLAAAGWDGSGVGEWLTGERPCLAVNADHDVQSLSCRLSGVPELVVPGHLLNAARPVFIEFPDLPAGAHVAEFTLTASDGRTERGEMELLVRERRPWAPGLTQDGALTVIVDPPAPTLEELWADRITVDLHGPSGLSVECRVRFWKRPGRQKQLERALPPLTLPATRHQWRERFRTSCRMVEDCQNAYDQADGITLDFVAIQAGRFELSAEREFTPLRWIARHRKQRYCLRLQDDRGADNAPVIVRYDFDSPAVGENQPSRNFTRDETEVEGGLYVAVAGEHSTAIIVAPRTFNLHDLPRAPHVEPVEASLDAIIALLGTIELWSRARQVGSTFSLRFAVPSVQALVAALFGALVDPTWARLEPEGLQELRRTIDNIGLARELSDGAAKYARMLPHRRVERFEQALAREVATAGVRRHRDDPRERLAEVALRFASDPGGVRAWAQSEKCLRGMISRLLHSKDAARAARYLVLATVQHVSQGTSYEQGILYPGWEWS